MTFNIPSKSKNQLYFGLINKSQLSDEIISLHVNRNWESQFQVQFVSMEHMGAQANKNKPEWENILFG